MTNSPGKKNVSIFDQLKALEQGKSTEEMSMDIAPMPDPMEGYDDCDCSSCVDKYLQDCKANYQRYVEQQKIEYSKIDKYSSYRTEYSYSINQTVPNLPPERPAYDLQDNDVFGGSPMRAVELLNEKQYLDACRIVAQLSGEVIEWLSIPVQIRKLGKVANIDPHEWVGDTDWSCKKFYASMSMQFGANFIYDMSDVYSGYFAYIEGALRLWKYKVAFRNRVSGYLYSWVYKMAPYSLLEAYKATVLPFLKYHGDKKRYLFSDSIEFNDVVLVSNMTPDLQEIASILLHDCRSGEAMVKLTLNLKKSYERHVVLSGLPFFHETVCIGSTWDNIKAEKFDSDMDALSSALNIGLPKEYVTHLLQAIGYETEADRINIIQYLLTQRRFFEILVKGIKAAGVVDNPDLDCLLYTVGYNRPSFMSLRDPATFVLQAVANNTEAPTEVQSKLNDKIAQRSPRFAKKNWAYQHEKGLKVGWLFKQVLEYMQKMTAEGHTFYIHGRDGEIVYQLAKRSGHNISCKFAITSRSLGPTTKDLNALDESYSSYLKRVFPQTNKKSIHLDSGFYGSVPRWFHNNGWDNTSSFVLVGARPDAETQKYQLPYTRREINGSIQSFDSLAATYMEDINHRLQTPDKWGKLKFDKNAGGFWAYIYGIEESIKNEWPDFYSVKQPRVGHVQQIAA